MKKKLLYQMWAVLSVFALVVFAIPANIVVADGHCIDGGFGDDHLVGTKWDDCLRARGGHDTVEGLWGDDFMGGGPGNDFLDGGIGDDDMRGGPGEDHVYGGTGDDILWGGGPNLINDHARDVVDGGTGYDICYVDPSDIVKNCEVVKY